MVGNEILFDEAHTFFCVNAESAAVDPQKNGSESKRDSFFYPQMDGSSQGVASEQPLVRIAIGTSRFLVFLECFLVIPYPELKRYLQIFG